MPIQICFFYTFSRDFDEKMTKNEAKMFFVLVTVLNCTLQIVLMYYLVVILLLFVSEASDI